jgi:glycosyltransferase involved in cell wall biosynthesis
MNPAMSCTLFDSPIDNINSFNHKQVQVMAIPDKLGLPLWSKKEVEYVCSFNKQKNYDASKPTAIIPIRNCSKIITMCMESMKKTNTFELLNVIIVDDRSTEDIKSIAKKYRVSYLRVDYDSTFNFSMLCNIGAKVCNDLGNTQVIMWNADLYIADRVNLESLLQKHNEKSSSLSGTKLLYPPLEYSLDSEYDTKNIMSNFPQMAGKWRGTIQYGGDDWLDIPGSFLCKSPVHAFRFTNDPLASVDRRSSFITGAFQIIQLDKFIESGGYNPSLLKSFQDVDLSMNIPGEAWYFGDSGGLYHDESPVFEKHNSKVSIQNISDHQIFQLLNPKGPKND